MWNFISSIQSYLNPCTKSFYGFFSFLGLADRGCHTVSNWKWTESQSVRPPSLTLEVEVIGKTCVRPEGWAGTFHPVSSRVPAELVCCVFVLCVLNTVLPAYPLFVIRLFGIPVITTRHLLPHQHLLLPALDHFLQLQLKFGSNYLSGTLVFVQRRSEKISVIWCCVNCWAAVFEAWGRF